MYLLALFYSLIR